MNNLLEEKHMTTPTIDLSTWDSASVSSEDEIQLIDKVSGEPKFTRMSIGSLGTYLTSNLVPTTCVSSSLAQTASLATTSSYIVFSTASGIVSRSSSGSGQGNATLYVNISGSSYYINLYNAKA